MTGLPDSRSEARLENARLIADSAGFLVSPDRLARVRAGRARAAGIDPGAWREAIELGWLGLRVPEHRGGIGFGLFELCALAEQLGAGLSAEPFIEAICLAPLLPDDMLGSALAGQSVVLPAWRTGSGAEPHLDQGRVTGALSHVLGAAGADAFVLPAGDALVLVARDDIEITTVALQDGGHFGMLNFTAAPARSVPGTLELLVDEVRLATSAYLLGAMEKTFEITKAYLGTRAQFGRPIGSFQALQHRMVDLYVQIQLARASIRKAVEIVEEEGGAAGAAAVSRAKARASDAATLVTRQAVQLHGGIGFTDECDVGLFLRKAIVLAGYCGTAAQHRARFGRLTEGRAKDDA